MKKIIRTLFPAVAMAAGLMLLGRMTQAETLNFQTLNNAGDPFFNQLLGINNAGTIAGYFGDGTVQVNQGYTLVPPTSYTNENFPGSVQTQVVGINNSVTPQTTVGFYIDGNGNNFGFVDLGGTFTQVNDPSNTSRDFGYAGDYVDAMWRMLQQATPGDYVVAHRQDLAVVRSWIRLSGWSVSTTGRPCGHRRPLRRPAEVDQLGR